MSWFLFYPKCDITDALLACSHGWVMYFLFGFYSVISFQNLPLSLIHHGCFILASTYFEFGLPWYEAVWHLAMGNIVGWWLVWGSGMELTKVLRIKLNFFEDMSKLLRLSLGFLTFFFCFYGIDNVIIENNHPYGIALAAVLCFTWVLAIGSFFFCAERVKDNNLEEQSKYWVFWSELLIAAVVSFLVAFIPSFSAYYKTIILAPILSILLFLHAKHHRPLGFRPKVQ